MSCSGPHRHALGPQRVQAVGQRAEHALDRRARQVRRRRVAQPQAVQRAGGVGLVGRALALEVGDQDEPVGPGRRGQRERAEAGVVDAEHPRGGVEHARGVERAGEREEAAGGVGEPGDEPGPVGGRLPPRSPRRRPEVPMDTATSPSTMPRASAARGVVARTGAQHGAAGGAAARPPGATDAAAGRRVDVAAQREREQVAAVVVGARGTSSRCRRRPSGRSRGRRGRSSRTGAR